MKSKFHSNLKKKEKFIEIILKILTAISIITTIVIIYILLKESLGFFREVSIVEFLTGTEWTALFSEPKFGVLPLIVGTLLVTAIGMVIAIPVGLGSAIYLSEYASKKARRILKPSIELLAGIPTIVYGYFAVTFISPILKNIFKDADVFNSLSAGIAVGIMILPMITSLSEDAMRAVPKTLREGAYGLGANKLEVSTKIVIPASLSTIIASFILGISRAIGETMIVTLAAGSTPNLTLDPLESIQTMTAFIAQVASGDVSHDGLIYKTIFAVGLLLFIFTLIMNLISKYIIKRFKEEY